MLILLLYNELYFNQEEEFYEFFMLPEKFDDISKKLELQDLDIEGQVSLVPNNTIDVSEGDANKIIKLLEIIENQEDVQKVHSNFQII